MTPPRLADLAVASVSAPDTTITATDLSLGSALVMILGPGAERTVSVDATIPANLAGGSYPFGAVADYVNTVAESDEGHNALAGNTLMSGPGP